MAADAEVQQVAVEAAPRAWASGAWTSIGRALARSSVRRGVLAAALLIGAVLRFQGLDWDSGQHLHPDERFLTMVTTALSWPSSLAEYFDTAASPLNPYNRGFTSFVYGTFPIFLTKLVADLTGLTGYGQLHLAGRALSGALDLACVALVYLIGRRLYDARVGLLAAVLLALSAFNIQQSHFFTVDPVANLLLVLALYWSANLARGGRWINAVGLGLAYGLAVASKLNVAVFGVIIVLAWWQWYLARRTARTPLPVTDQPAPARRLLIDLDRVVAGWSLTLRVGRVTATAPRSDRPLLAALGGGLVTLLIAVLAFRVAQPYAFIGPGFFDIALLPTWLQSMAEIGTLISGERDYPASHQWAFRTPYLFPWLNMVQWGMGWALGLAAWAGVGLAAWEVLARRRFTHLLLLTWVVVLFGWLGGGFVLTMRYFLPIYPALVLLAAYLLVWLWDRARASAVADNVTVGRWRLRRPGLLPIGAASLVVGLVVLTGAWAIAFTEIYRQPNTRVNASRWIYATVPRGAVFGWEHWDDPLPLRVDGQDGSRLYRGVELPLYAEDTPEKLYGTPGRPGTGLLDKLDDVEWIFISSGRLYTSIPRLPMRYPMTTRYYQALMSGELGFVRVRTFQSFPTLLGLAVNDQGAEEQFTVYDHPQVDIYRKTPGYTRVKAEAILGNVDWAGVQKLTPLAAMRARNGLLLDPSQRELQAISNTWTDLFDQTSPVNTQPWLAVLAWLLSVGLMGCIAFPLAFVAMRGLPDGGWGLARTLGLLLTTYLVWLGASLRLASFGRPAIVAALVALGLGAAVIAWQQRAQLVGFLRRRWWLLAVEEALFLIAFAGFLLIRAGNPDLWHPGLGGEKPMDFAYLNAVLRSVHFPPYDPWFAGGYINYYYFGFVMVGSLMRLTGIVPWIGYNLAVPLLFALTALGVFSVAIALAALVRAGDLPRRRTGRRRAIGLVATGLLGVLFVTIIGNLGTARLYLTGLALVGEEGQDQPASSLGVLYRTGAGLWRVLAEGRLLPFRQEWPYWNATRIIPGTINEFPYFTFLYGDLHAHMLALPLVTLVLGMAVALVRRPFHLPAGLTWRWIVTGRRVAPLLVLALAVGALWPTNAWDYPTYLLVGLTGLSIGAYRHSRGRRIWLRDAAVGASVVFIASRVFYEPFFASYAAPSLAVALWTGDRTRLDDYLAVHGLFLFLIGLWLIWEARPVVMGWVGGRNARWRIGLTLGTVLCATVLAAALFGLWVVALVAVLLTLVLIVWQGPDLSRGKRLALALVALGLALSVVGEIAVLKGDVGRMNTVFKSYLQVWVILGLVAALATTQLLATLPRRRDSLWPWTLAGVLVLLVPTLAYPVVATQARLGDRFPNVTAWTLDGRAFLEEAVYQDRQPLTLRHDREAIDWLLNHVEGTPVIVEGHTPEYRWGSRFSIYTGLPTVVGWSWHQRQQRPIYNEPVVERRIQDVEAIYTTTDPNEALARLRTYGAQYLVVGELERATYAAAGLAKFDEMAATGSLETVYRAGPVTIYRVRGAPLDLVR